MNSYLLHPNPIASKVADRVSALLAYWDKDLICRFANGAYLKWFGKEKEEVVDTMTIKELLGPLYCSNLPYIQNVLKGEVQTFERETILPNGTVQYTLANFYPDFAGNEVIGFYVHVADITPLKLLEKKLIKSNQTIKEQNQRLLNFSNVISHNLKSYAVSLSSLLSLLKENDDEEEKERLYFFLNRLSDRFSGTVNHLNEIVTAQNQASINFEIINLQEYVEKTVQILQVQIDESHAVILNKIDPKVKLFANPAYMESILLNFLTNAIKYCHPERNPLIELNSSEENDTIIVTIKDNGQGIDLEKHGEELFGMYKTFHGNTDAQGIGLFITKYQIDTMGGQIEVESQENMGTTFKISFNTMIDQPHF
jgi:PAS domain S-box-containing protein